MKDRLWLTESLGGESEAMSKKNLQRREEGLRAGTDRRLRPPGTSPPSGRVKVALHKVVKRPHVFFFRKQDVVCDALQNLKHRRRF